MDRPNIFMDDTEFNICLSWLCDSTDGQTYSISDCFAKKLKRPDGMSESEWYDKTADFFSSTFWDDGIGYKHDYRVDDPAARAEAERMVKDLNALVDRLNADPDFSRWDVDGKWVLEVKKNQVTQSTFKYSGMKREACRVCAKRIAAESNSASIKHSVDGIADRLLTHGWLVHEDYFFEFRKVEEV